MKTELDSPSEVKTMVLPFSKWHSIGNDFPVLRLRDVKLLDSSCFGRVVPPAAQGIPKNQVQEDFARLSELSILLSDRHSGIGGDGILVVEPMEPKTDAEVLLRMFNPDGTEDFCGNGLRIAASYAFKNGWVDSQFRIKHLDRILNLTIEGNLVHTEIGKASYKPEDVPHSGRHELFAQHLWSGMDSGVPLSLFGSSLTTGSTHSIIQTHALPDDDTFESVSAKVEVDSRFPMRTSVIWSKRTNPDTLEIRIWERGAGETLGCGTGSTAAAVDEMRRRNKGGKIEVRNPGGTVWVSAENWSAPVTISGESSFLFDGQVDFTRS